MTAKPETRSSRLLKIMAVITIVAVVVVLARQAGAYVPRFAAWVDTLGLLGPLVFIAGYATAVVAFVPASALTLGAGAIFGLAEGTAYVFVAATLGASLAFLVSRTFGRELVQHRIQGDARFDTIDRAISDQGRRIVFLLRLSPVFPFNLLNYALGLTRVRFSDYLLACTGMLPGTLMYVYLGYVGGGLASAAGGVAPERGTAYFALQAVGLTATIAVTVIVTRIAKRALNEATGDAVRD